MFRPPILHYAEVVATACCTEVRHRRFDALRILAGFQAPDYFFELRAKILARLIRHSAHEPGQRFRIVFIQALSEHIVWAGHIIQVTVFRTKDGNARYQPCQVFSAAARANRLAALDVGIRTPEKTDASIAVLTSVLVDRHVAIIAQDQACVQAILATSECSAVSWGCLAMSDENQAAPASLEQVTRDWYRSLHRPRPLLVVVSGPSGVGKDATIQLMKERGYSCYFVVTATTRPRRPAEIDGVDYHFVSEATFSDLIARGELIEHALVYGQYKGIPKAGIRAALASGQDVMMRLDVQGAATIRRLVPEAVTVFLTAESEEALVERLRRRKTEDPAQLEQRIETARRELCQADEFKYRIVNRECALDETVDRLISIIEAEKSRIDWQPVTI